MTAPKPSAAELRLRALVRQWGMAMSEMDDSARAAFAADFSELLAAARAEAVAPVLEVLRQLVEAMPKCRFAGCGAIATAVDPFGGYVCDEHAKRFPEGPIGPVANAAAVRLALALLAADQADAKAVKP